MIKLVYEPLSVLAPPSSTRRPGQTRPEVGFQVASPAGHARTGV